MTEQISQPKFEYWTCWWQEFESTCDVISKRLEFHPEK